MAGSVTWGSVHCHDWIAWGKLSSYTIRCFIRHFPAHVFEEYCACSGYPVVPLCRLVSFPLHLIAHGDRVW